MRHCLLLNSSTCPFSHEGPGVFNTHVAALQGKLASRTAAIITKGAGGIKARSPAWKAVSPSYHEHEPAFHIGMLRRWSERFGVNKIGVTGFYS